MTAFVVSAPEALAGDRFFARIGETLEMVYQRILPCAGTLHRHLLRRVPAGKTQLASIKELATAIDRSEKHVRRALNQLVENELVEMSQSPYRGVYEITAHREKGTKKRLQGTKKSLESLETLDIPLPSSRDIEKASIEPLAAAAAESPALEAAALKIDSEGFGSRPERPQSEEIRAAEPQAIEESKINPMRAAQLDRVQSAIAPDFLHPKLKAFILSYAYERVERNLDRLITRKRGGKVSNPAAFLVKAIQEDYARPVEAETRDRVVPDGFGEWFSRARAAGVVLASQLVNGIQLVLTSRDVWQPWEELREAYPLSSLPPA